LKLATLSDDEVDDLLATKEHKKAQKQ
jgi:hypothetical protein